MIFTNFGHGSSQGLDLGELFFPEMHGAGLYMVAGLRQVPNGSVVVQFGRGLHTLQGAWAFLAAVS
jgi:hypothetical protein